VTNYVIDASVAIKWVVDEEGTSEALALRSCQLFAPELLVPECANILWKKTRRRELSLEEAQLCARLLQRADIELMPMRPLLEAAMRLAHTLDHPACDCVYLALAENLSCHFVTADARLSAKVLSAEGKSRILPLTSIQAP